MLSFFLRIMKQKCGSYVCVQLLQTLNILFENIRNETSLCKLFRGEPEKIVKEKKRRTHVYNIAPNCFRLSS